MKASSTAIHPTRISPQTIDAIRHCGLRRHAKMPSAL
jgi:hypothetical protein